MKKQSKGITLVALVITIIILLILAGISISSLKGSELFSKAQEATIISEIKEIEEFAKMLYMERKVDEITKGKSITIAEVISDLRAKGYKIKQSNGGTKNISGITVNTKKVIVERGTQKTITYAFVYKDEADLRYFVEIQGKNYEMLYNDGDIKINTKAIDLEKIDEEPVVKVKSSNTNIIDAKLTEEYTIKLEAQNLVGDVEIIIEEENNKVFKKIIATTQILATSINITQEKEYLEVGKNVQLASVVEPNNTTDTISWSTSNSSIATVSETGLVTGISKGVATITAKVGSQEDTCDINVVLAGSAATVTKDMIGKTVTNYTKGGQTWEIFFASYDNIYLITHGGVSDPIYNSKKLGNSINSGNYEQGTSMLLDKVRFPVTNDWNYGWIDKVVNSNTSYISRDIQIALFILDSGNVWNNTYCDSKYADFAMRRSNI